MLTANGLRKTGITRTGALAVLQLLDELEEVLVVRNGLLADQRHELLI